MISIVISIGCYYRFKYIRQLSTLEHEVWGAVGRLGHKIKGVRGGV